MTNLLSEEGSSNHSSEYDVLVSDSPENSVSEIDVLFSDFHLYLIYPNYQNIIIFITILSIPNFDKAI